MKSMKMKKSFAGVAATTVVAGATALGTATGAPSAAMSSATATPSPAANPVAMRDELLGHFQRSSYKIAELARVMPSDKYSWAPGEGVMEVGEVYMHIARYNFMYLDENLGIAPPGGFDYADIESIRDKDAVLEIFEMSVEHVNAQASALTEAKLGGDTELYGRTVQGWAVLVQLVSHMNEHVGQSVAYARMNDIAPPWSR